MLQSVVGRLRTWRGLIALNLECSGADVVCAARRWTSPAAVEEVSRMLSAVVQVAAARWEWRSGGGLAGPGDRVRRRRHAAAMFCLRRVVVCSRNAVGGAPPVAPRRPATGAQPGGRPVMGRPVQVYCY